MDTAHWFVAGIVGALLVNLAEEQGSHDARRPHGPAGPSMPRPRGNCHHTKRRTPNQPSALSTSQSPPCADALREAEAEPAVRVADLDEMMTLIDNA